MIATIKATRFWSNEPANLPVCYYEIWLGGSLIRPGDCPRLIWVEGMRVP